MTAWESLVQQGILGTTRQPNAVMMPPELIALLPLPTIQAPETHFLQAAALLTQYHAAGTQPGLAPSAVLIQPAPAERNPPAPSGAIALLRQLVGEGDQTLLGEWLQHAARLPCHLPPDLLPALLTLATKHPALAAALAPCLGERGRWLLRLHPDWLLTTVTVELTAWEQGSPEARQHFLQAARQRDPQAARTHLERTWGQETAQDRANFLRTFRVGLSSADEPFLLQALADRSQAVRTEAARLLAGLSGSPLQQRLLDQVATYMRVERKWLRRTLQVKLPTSFAADWAQLGVRQQSPLGVRIGEKAGWLVQLVALLPPSRLVAHLGLDTIEFLEFVQASDFAEALGTALLEGAELQQDHPFLVAELQHFQRLLALAQVAAGEWLDRFVRYAPLLPPALRDQTLQRYLATTRTAAFADWTTLGTVLRVFDQCSPGVTATLLQEQLPALLARTTRDYGIGRVLRDCAYRLAPSGFPTAAKLFALRPGDERPDSIEHFLRIYQLRHQMEKEFAS
ncbi:MAG: hypothetical protein KF832_17030 [Caldilineaceae bacterium]|nr:hypothetical protein [Caldilineaceae bacterium]